jgi:DNA-binding transcriptional MerR regulator
MSKYSDDQIKFINKLKSQGLSWEEIKEAFNEEFDGRYSLESLRHAYRRYSFAVEEVTDAQYVVKSMQDKARVGKAISTLRKENQALLEYISGLEAIGQQMTEILQKNPPLVYEPISVRSKKPLKRAVVAHYSDSHIQANIQADEMGGLNQYGNIEEARRTALFFREIANYKIEHRKDTELFLVLNGDNIQGVIHDSESVPAATTQVCAALHILRQGISFIATQFKKVTVVCTVGNHERMMHKSNKGRQTKQKWDSFSTILHVALRVALSQHKNIEFVIPTSPYAYLDILGHKFFITHSDTVINVGYPGKSINTERAKNTINDLKSGLGRIDVVMAGHVHVDSKTILPNGTTLLTNGSVSGIDEFALSLGITKNLPSQQIFEVTRDYAVGDLRSVFLSQADKDDELDLIIEPFEGKF